MEIRINRTRLIVTLVVIYVILSYPFNWYAMRNEWGVYSNDPNAICTIHCTHGGCMTCRGGSLFLSPLTLPGMYVNFLIRATDPNFKEPTRGQGNNDQD